MFLYTLLLAVVLLDHTELTEARNRIIGGSDADISEYPYQISLRFYNKHWCGGIIYQPNIIITAAHCFKNSRDPSDYTISAGYTLVSESQESAKVKEIIRHESYSNPIYADYDIAILVLDRNLEYNSKVQPIRLYQQKLPSGVPVTITGWGHYKKAEGLFLISDHLQQIELNFVSNDKCQISYPTKTKRMLCGGVEPIENDECQQDSGGPMIFEGELIGVVLFGIKCDYSGFKGVYAPIPDLYDWILETVKNNAGTTV